MSATLSLDQARRIALAAQGLHKGRPTGPVTARAVGRTFARLQLVQIDSVNVLDHDGKVTGRKVPVIGGNFDLDGARDKALYYEVVFK